MKTAFFAAAALLTVLAAPAEAQTVKQCVAHWTDTPPVIDGKLDDAAWRGVHEEGGFVKLSDPAKHPQAPTFVRILTDGKALYLGIRCVEPKLDKMSVTQEKHDDAVWTDDSLEVILDPDNRKAKLYHLIINSAGVQYDAEGKITPPETSNDAPEWNGKWESVCSRGRGEWYAEYRLPFDVFGISTGNGACLGLNFGRTRVGAFREQSCWAPTRTDYANPARLGELYLAAAGGQTLRLTLPRVLDVVRGSAKADFGFASTYKTPLKVRWSATLDGALKTVEQSDPLTVPANGSLKSSIPLSAPETGDCRLALTVRDADSGQVLYSGSRSFRILPEISVSESLYALGYQRAEANITVNLPPAASRGAHLEVALLRRGDTVPIETRIERASVRAPITTCFTLHGRSAGDYVLRARLCKGERTIASADSRPFPFMPNPTVGFDKNGFLTVEGKPFFPVGLYTIQAKEGSHDTVMEESRQAGFNTTVFYAYTVDTITPLLDAAARHGLRAFVYPADPYHVRENTATREELIGEIRARMHHPALLGWYVVDEPEGIGVASVQTVRNYYQLIKETDPSHPCSLVIMTPGAAANYGHSTDIMWIDPYPVPYNPVTYVSECMDGARASVPKDKPVWAIPQAFDWSVWKTGAIDKIHRPTPEEERCMTYLALVHGAKGIIYWAHTGSKYYIHDYPEHWAALKKIAGELRDLSPVLLTTDSPLKASLSPRTATLDTMVKELDGRTYVFAVNREPASTQARISLKGAKAAANVEVLFENRTLPASRNGWTDQFGPLEVHIYRLAN